MGLLGPTASHVASAVSAQAEWGWEGEAESPLGCLTAGGQPQPFIKGKCRCAWWALSTTPQV